MISLGACKSQEEVSFRNPRMCAEMQDWLIAQNKVNSMPICGVIWIKQIGDKNETQ